MTSLTLQNYVNQLPKDIAIKAAQGAIVTATISLCFGAALPVALLGGTIAATATLIEALARPLIATIFPNNSFIRHCAQVIIPCGLALKLATSATPWLGIGYKTSVVALSFLATLILNEPTKDNVAFAWVF